VRLLPLVDAVVVVGGRNSNNTRELAALCRDRGVPRFTCNPPPISTRSGFAAAASSA